VNPVSPKVSNAAGASGASTPLTILFIYYLNKYNGPLDPVVAGAWAALITGIAGFLGGWLTKLEPLLLPITTTVTKTEEGKPATYSAPAQPATTHTTTTTEPAVPGQTAPTSGGTGGA